MGCRNCPLNGQIKVEGIVKEADICIVGESPGQQEQIQGEPFVGRSGKLLMQILKECLGLERNDVAIINALECELPKEYKDNVTRYRKILRECREKFLLKINKIKPRLIIACGIVAIKQVLNRNVSFSSVRGKLIDVPELNAKVFTIYHPSSILRRGGLKPENPYWAITKKDLEYLHSLLNGKKETTFFLQEFKGSFAEFSKSKYIAIDCEWDKDENLLVFSISDGKHTFYIEADKLTNFIKNKINKLIGKKVIILANRPADERILRKYGINISFSKVRIDVFNLARLVNENLFSGSMSLEKISELYADKRGIKDITKGRKKEVWKLPKEELINYNAVDSIVTAKSFATLYEELKKDARLYNYWKNFILPVEDMLANICSVGFPIDINKLQENLEIVKKVELDLSLELISQIPQPILEGHKEIKLTRNELIRDLLFKHKKGFRLKPEVLTPTGEPSVSEEALTFYRDHPWIAKYLEWKKVNKLIHTYFNGLLKNIKPDGKIYPSIVLWGTVTGRTVCFNPNIQQVPRQMPYLEYYKSLFRAPKGWLMGMRDLSQSEIRIMGWLANEKRILEALREGIDIHSLTASLILKKPIEEVTKEERQMAKAVNFGFLYGAQAKTFKDYAFENYGVDISIEEAEEFRKRFFETYPAIPVFHKKCELIVSQNKYIRSPLGRKRRLPEIDSDDYHTREEAIRKAINFPIQSFSSDLTLIGMYLFWKEIKEKKTVRLLWMIHDSIFFIARKDVFDEYMELLKDCMEKRAVKYIEEKFLVKVGYPVESEGKYGESWADLIEYKI